MKNTTIISKKKNLACGHYDYNFSKGRCKSCATIDGTKRRMEIAEEYHTEESRSNIIQDLDAIFSQYIRLMAADDKGMISCFVCDKPLHYKSAHNMHYIQRSETGLRYSVDNCYAGCPQCNALHETDTAPFTKKINQHKIGLSEILINESRTVNKTPTSELKEMLIDYRNKVKVLKTKIK